MKQFLDWLRELIEGGFLGQAVIATAVVFTSCYLVINGREVPEWFTVLVGAVIAYYFHQQQQARAYRQEIKLKSVYPSQS